MSVCLPPEPRLNGLKLCLFNKCMGVENVDSLINAGLSVIVSWLLAAGRGKHRLSRLLRQCSIPDTFPAVTIHNSHHSLHWLHNTMATVAIETKFIRDHADLRQLLTFCAESERVSSLLLLMTFIHSYNIAIVVRILSRVTTVISRFLYMEICRPAHSKKT